MVDASVQRPQLPQSTVLILSSAKASCRQCGPSVHAPPGQPSLRRVVSELLVIVPEDWASLAVKSATPPCQGSAGSGGWFIGQPEWGRGQGDNNPRGGGSDTPNFYLVWFALKPAPQNNISMRLLFGGGAMMWIFSSKKKPPAEMSSKCPKMIFLGRVIFACKRTEKERKSKKRKALKK